MVNINFGEIADIAFNNILGTSGVVIEGVVYSVDAEGNNVATDTTEQTILDEMNR